jgi:hypothetical protein
MLQMLHQIIERFATVKNIIEHVDKKEKLLTKAREDLISIQDATVEKESEINRIHQQISLQQQNFGIEIPIQSRRGGQVAARGTSSEQTGGSPPTL